MSHQPFEIEIIVWPILQIWEVGLRGVQQLMKDHIPYKQDLNSALTPVPGFLTLWAELSLYLKPRTVPGIW